MNNKLLLSALLGLLVVVPGCSFVKNDKKAVKENAAVTEIVVEEEVTTPENPMIPSEDTELK